jgi:hypothetical protein
MRASGVVTLVGRKAHRISAADSLVSVRRIPGLKKVVSIQIKNAVPRKRGPLRFE